MARTRSILSRLALVVLAPALPLGLALPGWALPGWALPGQALPKAPGGSGPDEAAADGSTELLDPDLLASADAAVEAGLGFAALRGTANELFDAAVSAHGDLDLLDAHLGARAGETGETAAAATCLRAHLAWRLGDQKEALAFIEALPGAIPVADSEGPVDLDAALARAALLDALGRSKNAIETYALLVPLIESEDEVLRVRLRMALMSMESGEDEQKDALAKFASEDGRSLELRNRCAIVLALLGRPGDAADLYSVPELDVDVVLTPSERKARRKAAAVGELRIAEWAIRAADWPRAQTSAWRAMQLSTVKREIRYALTLLAEAHRGDDSLAALLERFAAESESLPGEAREAWIELLRETGGYDEAIGMVSSGALGGFSREERRRLLEMYREAGREDEMVRVYEEWTAGEPRQLVWRSGLARHYLEEGDRDAAIALWDDWFGVFQRAGDPIEKPLDAADALEALGLDDLAIRAANAAILPAGEGGGSTEKGESALLFLYDLHRSRGRLEEARDALVRLDEYADPGSPSRMPLSDCFERLGELEEAVRVLENVRAARGIAKAGEDLEMRLAWLYSEVGNEDKALALWRDLWTRVNSVARRRFVEDRMMTVAARLGVLADIAVELEKRLFAGEASERDSGLLVRLYTKVGDAVSAAEIVDEFLRLTGGTELDALTEKARVYLACNDFYHYEQAVAELIELDPDGKPDYFRQLAMSQLERGKPDQARATLMRLQELPGETDDSSAEFEAGVLSLSGLREEAIAAYRRGLAAHPERIDSYLLMAALMKQIRQSNRAVGMFQYLAENADRDDLFTIAIDGCLNMLVDAPPRPKMVQWARRITLERLAGREDAPYLYQLLADLAEETGDESGHIAALENSLGSAGPRRSSVLRELMDLSKPARGGFNQPSREGDRDALLAFGRRLVGLGELVPPEVYLDLGDAFLEAGDEGSAARTFDLTREFPDGELYQQQAAERFEKAGFIDRALERYQAVLAASPTDVPLLAKVGELREALGDDAGALELYRRGFEVLLGRKPLYELAKKEDEDEGSRFWAARNVDEYDQFKDRVVEGILATLPANAAVAAFVSEQREAIEREYPLAVAAREAALVEAAGDPGGPAGPEAAETELPRFASHPRLVARAEIVRDVAFATDAAAQADTLDRWVIAAFPGDEQVMIDALETRVRWGRFAGARRLVEQSDAPLDVRQRLLARLGGGAATTDASSRPIPFDTAVAAVLPLFESGDIEGMRQVVRRADLTQVEQEKSGRVAVLLAAARAAGDDELVLRVARDWIRVELGGDAYPYVLEQRIDALLGLMPQETGLALAQYFVRRVLEDPEKNSKFVTILPKLTQRFGDDVVETEDVRTLLDGFGDGYAWGLSPVIALLPAAERAGALRGVWGKLEAANRASFLLDTVTEATDDLPVELAAFIAESFPAALEKADDFIQYSVSELLDVDHSHGLVVEMARTVLDKKPELEQAKAIEMVHRHLFGEGGLAPEAATAWLALASSDSDDWNVRRGADKLAETFASDDPQPFLDAIDAKVAQDGGSAKLTLARASLLRAADRHEEAAVVLETALKDESDNLELWQALRSVQLKLGRSIAAAETLETIAELEKNEAQQKRHWKSLVRTWTSLQAPERALAASEKLGDDAGTDSGIPGFPAGFVIPMGAVYVINGVTYVGGDEDKKKGLPKSFADVREALDDPELDEGLVMRRLWRQFPVGQPRPRVSYGPYRYRNLTLANLTWPADEVEEEESADDADDKKGGFLGYDPLEPEPKPEPPNAYDRMNVSDALVAEQERFLRTVSANELDRLQRLLEGLLKVEAARTSDEAVLERLLAKADAGDAGRADQIRLLALLDQNPERVTGAAAEALSQLVRTIPPRDASQVRRLARVLLQSGAKEEALRLYRWCALQSSELAGYGNEDSLDVVTYVSNRDLVKEARDHLEGDAQLALIETVLETSRPVDSPWQRESYETLVLDTWDDVVAAADARERAREVIDAALDLSTGLRRSVALRAASILVRAGDHAEGLRALEIGVAKLDSSLVAQPEERWYRSDPERVGYLGIEARRRLFPPLGGDIPDAASWFAQAADSIEAWRREERWDESAAVDVLALLAIRLDEVGEGERARALASRLRGAADLAPNSALWVVDALRQLGYPEEAMARERALLAEGRLNVERMAATVAAIRELEGGEAALAAASSVSDVVRHPALMDELVLAAIAANDEEEAQRWRDAKAAAEMARAALEESDKK